MRPGVGDQPTLARHGTVADRIALTKISRQRKREATKMSGHKGESLVGRLKESVGRMTGDKSLQRDGKVDQASAAAKKQFDRAADKLSGAIKPKK